MADIRKRLSTNVDGNVFVDSTCINCDACRQLAPEVFREQGNPVENLTTPTGN